MAKTNESPVVLIGSSGSYCQGVLVSDSLVVSEAACVAKFEPSLIKGISVPVHIDVQNISSKAASVISSETSPIASISKHSGFNAETLENNIAAVFLAKPVVQAPASLPSASPEVNDIGFAAYSFFVSSPAVLSDTMVAESFFGKAMDGVTSVFVLSDDKATSTPGHHAAVFDQKGTFVGFTYYDARSAPGITPVLNIFDFQEQLMEWIKTAQGFSGTQKTQSGCTQSGSLEGKPYLVDQEAMTTQVVTTIENSEGISKSQGSECP